MIATKKIKILTEAQEQIELIRWWRDECCCNFHFWPFALFHIPNGGSRHVAEATRLKRQGVCSGVPDLLLAAPRGNYHGLWIELKRIRGGVIKPEQKEFIAWLREQGYAAFVCKGSWSAKHLIYQYLSDPDSLTDYTDLIYKEVKNGPCSTNSAAQVRNFKLSFVTRYNYYRRGYCNN